MLASEGDSVWLCWRPSREPIVVYPGKILRMVSAAPDSVTVRFRSYQVDGFYDDPQDIILRRASLCLESDINMRSRLHLDWSYRTRPMGDSDFHLSLCVTQSTPPGPSSVDGPPTKRRGFQPMQGGPQSQLEDRVARLESGLSGLMTDMSALRGRFDAWDVTVSRMGDYQRQHAMLVEEVRKLKLSVRLDASPGDATAGPVATFATTPQAQQRVSASDPLCSACGKDVAYDAPMHRLLPIMMGEGTKLDLADMFTIPGFRVKANSGLKKLFVCKSCEKGSLKLVVCTSGGCGQRRACDWCRCYMSSSTTDAVSGLCGKKHSNCRGLVVDNESDRTGNSAFLAKGVAAMVPVVPWDEVRLIDTGLEQWNDADYIIVAKSSLGKVLIIIEIDNRCHAGGGESTSEKERDKNSGNFKAAGDGFDRILFLRINPCGPYSTPQGSANTHKHARWLVAREWWVTFLRAPFGAWAYGDKVLLYLYYNHDSPLIDHRTGDFTTLVAYQPPALPIPLPNNLADWACSLDPMLLTKGSQIAQEHLSLNSRLHRPL